MYASAKYLSRLLQRCRNLGQAGMRGRRSFAASLWTRNFFLAASAVMMHTVTSWRQRLQTRDSTYFARRLVNIVLIHIVLGINFARLRKQAMSG